MMKKLFKLALIAAFVSGSYSSALAQERGEMLERLFSRMDRNEDGAIEKSEAPAEFWARMSKADTNNDGKIDKTEAKEGMKSQMTDRGPREGAKGDREKGEKPAESRDGDAKKPERSGPPDREAAEKLRQLVEKLKKDGKIALDEVPAPMREKLAKLDTNSDKIIEQSEIKGKNLMDLLRVGNGDVMEGMRRMIQALDKDGDGKIALTEIPEQARERVAKLDANNDGIIEKSELRGVMDGKRAEGKPGEGKLEGRYGSSESTAPQDPKRPDSK
jgi:Ca2+-binding EF-hand superfamily protein